MTEIWKSIPEYPNYSVSSFGRVLSMAQTKPKVLKPILVDRGYYQVALCEKGTIKRRQVHRLVAEAFCPKIPGKEYVNHKNGIKTDNRAENLEWVTAKENVCHARDVLRVDYKNANGFAKPVIRSDGTLFSSLNEASRETGCRRGNIQLVLHGKRKRCGGYGWSYA